MHKDHQGILVSESTESLGGTCLFMCVLESDDKVTPYDFIHGIAVPFMKMGSKPNSKLKAPISGQSVMILLRFTLWVLQYR